MKRQSKIKFLTFLIISEGAIFLLPPMLAFIAGLPYLFIAISASIGALFFAICFRLNNFFTEQLRKLNRSPIETLIEDNGLSEKEAIDAWNELDNLRK